MNQKRIVVTGLGVVSCFGNDVETFYHNLLEGISGISSITSFDCSEFSTQFAAQIKDFDPGIYIDKKQARRVDPVIAYTLVAGKKALEMANVTKDTINPARCGALVGSGMGGMSLFVDNILTLKEKGPKRVSPFFIPYILTNMPGALLANDFGFMGPNYSISTACATGNHAIIAAANHIRKGDADLMVCGGVEAPIIPAGLAGFCAVKALSQRNDDPTKASRPWDVDRDGFVMGEGAGILILESEEHARKRGAHILAEYLGGGISCDAHHMTEPRPDGEGVSSCIRYALKDANVSPDQVNYINAHATSTPAGDMVEVAALKKVFSSPETIAMNATKSLIGHALGGAAALEAVVVVQAIQKKIIHPTLNLDNPEPGLGFLTPTKKMPLSIQVALSNSFGFGGHNAATLFAPFNDKISP